MDTTGVSFISRKLIVTFITTAFTTMSMSLFNVVVGSNSDLVGWNSGLVGGNSIPETKKAGGETSLLPAALLVVNLFSHISLLSLLHLCDLLVLALHQSSRLEAY